KLILIGGTFILVSGIVYFLFIAVWLNAFLLIGISNIVRLLIGIGAAAAGVYYLKEFITYRPGVCKVSKGRFYTKILEKMKELVANKITVISFLLIVLLAFAVNLVEFWCSFGLPTIYTGLLVASNLPMIQYYLYMLLYIALYMLDDFIIFVAAVHTFKLMHQNEKYAKYTHLIAGLLLLFLGLFMLNPLLF
ncbi:hypothetical protein JXA85_00230, partial [Candidatus Woesearchaeota archaeon]|nr:hypothetical protein [Candidatus Woesearchaeota archaeon]